MKLTHSARIAPPLFRRTLRVVPEKTSTTTEIPIAATGKTGTTLAKPAGDSRPTDADGLEGLLPVVPLGADFAPAGRSMRDDGVDYSLIVSL